MGYCPPPPMCGAYRWVAWGLSISPGQLPHSPPPNLTKIYIFLLIIWHTEEQTFFFMQILGEPGTLLCVYDTKSWWQNAVPTNDTFVLQYYLTLTTTGVGLYAPHIFRDLLYKNVRSKTNIGSPMYCNVYLTKCLRKLLQKAFFAYKSVLNKFW